MSYCDCDMDDYDPPVFFRVSKVRAARRQHKCVECGGAILVGEPYQRVEGKWEAGVEVTMAKIIHLEHFRHGLRHAGIVFPQIYRVSGFCWEFEDPVAQTGMVADMKNPVGPFYMLDDTDHGSLCHTKFEQINRLDPMIDHGWVIVRHHRNSDFLDGYLSGYFDVMNPDFDQNPGAVVYHTRQGIFSCVHRPAIENRPNAFLIFVAKGLVPAGPATGMEVDQHKIIGPDGNELADDVLCGERHD
jgi:hypothetical protein